MRLFKIAKSGHQIADLLLINGNVVNLLCYYPFI